MNGMLDVNLTATADGMPSSRGAVSDDKDQVREAMEAAFAPLRNRSFATEHGAARALHAALLPVTEQFKVELGAQIFKTRSRFEAGITWARAVTDYSPTQISGRTMFYGSLAPRQLYSAEMTLVANWHTHPSGATFSYPGNSANGFRSPGDLGGYIDSRQTGYVSLAVDQSLLKFRTSDYLATAPLSFNYDEAKAYVCVVTGSSRRFQPCN